MQKKVFLVLFVALLVITGNLFAGGQKQAAAGEWKPTKPIHIIVPWGAGGSTDQATRIVVPELEKGLGARIVIDNQPGASGSTGTKNVIDAPRDGYTWAAGAAADLATYKIAGMLDTNIKNDWDIYLSVANIGVIAVNVDSKYQTVNDLINDLKANPGQISIAVAGQLSAGHINMEMLRSATGVEYKLVTYDSGTHAVTAVVAGEAMVTTQLAVEMANMIRGKRIRPLAVFSTDDLNLEGYGTIPALSKFIPGFKCGLNYFGIYIPKGVPQEVVATVNRVWQETVMKSDDVKKYAAENGAIYAPSFGQAAQDAAFSYYQPVAWLYHDAGKTVVSPDTLGIPRP